MNYRLSFIKETIQDYKTLDRPQRKTVDKALKRILINPLPNTESGYGKPLSNLSDSKFVGLMEIKLKSSGLRIVYKLEKSDDEVFVIIIGARAESRVYEDAEKRVAKLED